MKRLTKSCCNFFWNAQLNWFIKKTNECAKVKKNDPFLIDLADGKFQLETSSENIKSKWGIN